MSKYCFRHRSWHCQKCHDAPTSVVGHTDKVRIQEQLHEIEELKGERDALRRTINDLKRALDDANSREFSLILERDGLQADLQKLRTLALDALCNTPLTLESPNDPDA